MWTIECYKVEDLHQDARKQPEQEPSNDQLCTSYKTVLLFTNISE